MTNQEWIDLKYVEDRYLEHLSLDELVQRTIDVLSNYPILGDDGRIGLPPMDEDGIHWFTLFCNIMTEMELRGAGFPDGFLKNAPLPKPTWPSTPRGAGILNRLAFQSEFLFKFGKEEHLRPILKAGRIRISPASSYSDPSLNVAQQDNELEVSVFDAPEMVRVQLVNQETLEDEGEAFHPIGNTRFTLSFDSNYYVVCLASTYDLRMFDDFPSDSCLVIRDPKRFVENLFTQFDDKTPKWSGRATFVTYYDPLRIKKMPPSVFFHKHFRYAYQREYRIVLRPPEPVGKIEPLFIEMGNLEEYCELIKV